MGVDLMKEKRGENARNQLTYALEEHFDREVRREILDKLRDVQFESTRTVNPAPSSARLTLDAQPSRGLFSRMRGKGAKSAVIEYHIWGPLGGEVLKRFPGFARFADQLEEVEIFLSLDVDSGVLSFSGGAPNGILASEPDDVKTAIGQAVRNFKTREGDSYL